MIRTLYAIRLAATATSLAVVMGMVGPSVADAAPAVYDTFASLPAGSRPEAVIAGPDGSLYTVDSGTDSVSKVRADGTVDPTFSSNLPAFSLPQSIAQDARGDLFVTSLTLSTVYKLDPLTGSVDTSFSAALAHSLDGRHPIAVTTSAEGEIFTLNQTDETVSRISPTGTELDRYPLAASAESQALGFAEDGRLYVANSGDHSVSRISFDSGMHATVDERWADLAPSLHPIGLAADNHGFVYTVSWVGETVSKIDLELPTGSNVVAEWNAPGTKPFAIAADASGNVYTTDLATNTVSMYAVDGSVHGVVADLGGTPFEESLTASGGTVYLANSDTSTITRVDMAPIILSTTALGTAEVGSAYRQTISATGVEPLTYSALGDLPPGLTLDARTGVLSGTPAGAGTFDFDVAAVNVAGRSAPQHVTITVSLPEGSTGCWYWSEACGL